MQKFKVTLRSTSPYMQHRMDDLKLQDWEKQRGRIIERDDIAHEDAVRAEYHSFHTSDGKYYLPSAHFMGSFIEAGKLLKSKVGNATKSMKNIVAGMFVVGPDEISLPPYDLIDKRSAVNQHVKSRVITVRPKWSKWEVTFDLLVKNDTITDEMIKNIVEYAGMYIGIGSYRPMKSGGFGCFELVKMQREGGKPVPAYEPVLPDEEPKKRGRKPKEK